MNQSGREAASRPDTCVSATVSPTVHAGPGPVSWTIRRSTIPLSMWRKAIASPRGDQTGAQDRLSSLSRASSDPFEASRITTSVPSPSVFVAATNRPSGE
jgi:hypothetical protein